MYFTLKDLKGLTRDGGVWRKVESLHAEKEFENTKSRQLWSEWKDVRNELRIQSLASIKRITRLINHKDLRMRCSSRVQQQCPTLCNSMDYSPRAPLSMGFPRQEYWSGLPFPSPGNLPNSGIEPLSPALAGRFFTTEPPGKPTEFCRRKQHLPLCR